MSTSNQKILESHCRALGECRRCDLAGGIRPVVARAKNPRVMLVGQAPGKVEAEGGQPFAGRAGKTLFRWLAQCGLTEEAARNAIYIAAVTRCYPGPHPAGRGDRVPTSHPVEHVGGRSSVIPLPHPSGASSWIHQNGNRALVEQAIHLIGQELVALGLTQISESAA